MSEFDAQVATAAIITWAKAGDIGSLLLAGGTSEAEAASNQQHSSQARVQEVRAAYIAELAERGAQNLAAKEEAERNITSIAEITRSAARAWVGQANAPAEKQEEINLSNLPPARLELFGVRHPIYRNRHAQQELRDYLVDILPSLGQNRQRLGRIKSLLAYGNILSPDYFTHVEGDSIEFKGTGEIPGNRLIGQGKLFTRTNGYGEPIIWDAMRIFVVLGQRQAEASAKTTAE